MNWPVEFLFLLHAPSRFFWWMSSFVTHPKSPAGKFLAPGNALCLFILIRAALLFRILAYCLALTYITVSRLSSSMADKRILLGSLVSLLPSIVSCCFCSNDRSLSSNGPRVCVVVWREVEFVVGGGCSGGCEVRAVLGGPLRLGVVVSDVDPTEEVEGDWRLVWEAEGLSIKQERGKNKTKLVDI